MQVEYEDEITVTMPTADVLPPPALSDHQGASDEEEQDEEPDEEEEQIEAGSDQPAKTKAKRIIKQRQSLAEKQPGTTIFPISRVKKICKADKELDMMTSEATFMVSVATEYFIKHFMEEGYTKARLDKRKLVTYKDMANVVARSEEFDFLRDVIPLPITMSEALKARKEKQANDDNPMEDDDETGPVDLTGSDILPPLAQSTNPLYPNAIVKRPANTHSKGASKASKPAVVDEKKEREREEREAREREKKAFLAAGPSSQTKPYGAKYAPTVQTSLTTRSRRSLAASEVDAELAEVREAVAQGGEVPDDAMTTAESAGPVDDRMEQD